MLRSGLSGAFGFLNTPLSPAAGDSWSLEWEFLAFLEFLPFLALPTRPLTVQSFTAPAVLFPDCQKLTNVKQRNVALPLLTKNL